MKKRILLLLTAGVLAATAVACGGGGEGPTATPQIRSQKGLLVAAAVRRASVPRTS